MLYSACGFGRALFRLPYLYCDSCNYAANFFEGSCNCYVKAFLCHSIRIRVLVSLDLYRLRCVVLIFKGLRDREAYEEKLESTREIKRLS